jgi:cytochrome c
MRSFLLAAVLRVIVLPGTVMAVDGETIFLEKCAACHGLEGKGRSGVAPAFKEA